MMSALRTLLRNGLAAAAAAALVLACAETTDLPLPRGAFRVQDTGLNEMSGLEASPNHPGQLWSVNDSGSRPILYRLGLQGENLGRVHVRGTGILQNDWETLAFWREGGRTWLLIGDVGDNKGRRDHVNVYALPEPAPGETVARVAWTLRFRYPDGPRDAEGIAIDAQAGDLLVLSKRDVPQKLYRVPLSARGAAEPAVAELVTVLPPLPAQATGLDVTKDGRAMAVLSYRGLHVWRRQDGQAWAQVLAQPGRDYDLPRMSKAEAMAFGPDPGFVYIGSERVPTPLLAIALN